MRSTLIEILGYMIQELAKTIQENPAHMDQINNFFDVLKERLLDTHAYCRQKVFQVYLRLLEYVFFIYLLAAIHQLITQM